MTTAFSRSLFSAGYTLPRTASGANAPWGLVALAAALCCVLSAPALAQTAPNAGSLLRDQARPAPSVPALPGLATPPAAAKAPAPAAAAAQVSVTVTVSQLRFTGDADLATRYALADLAKPLLGRPATQAELFDLAEAMTDTRRSAGLVVASATLPPQDLSTGTLLVNISGGRLGSAGQQNGWQLNFPPTTSSTTASSTATSSTASPNISVQAPRLQRLAEASAASGSYLQ